MTKQRALMVLGGVASALLLIFAAPTPAQASPKSGACPSWICGSATWDAVDVDSNGRTFRFRYDTNVRDMTCSTGSDARIGMRVWYSDNTSEYGSIWVTDTRPCDRGYASLNNIWFRAPAGKDIAYFRTVFRDSQHPAGILGTNGTF
jgi:hypothetical protein